MNLVQKPLFTAAVAAAIGVGALGVNATLAAENEDRPQPFDKLITALSERFDLNPDEVRDVFEEQRDIMVEERQEKVAMKIDNFLDKAVQDGDLTEEQAQAIRDREDDERAFFESLKDMNPEDRQEALEKHKEEVKAWAEEHDLPEKYIRFGVHLMQGGPGHHFGKVIQKFHDENDEDKE